MKLDLGVVNESVPLTGRKEEEDEREDHPAHYPHQVLKGAVHDTVALRRCLLLSSQD